MNLFLLQLTNKTQENEISTWNQMILHLEFHPDDIPRKIVHDLWSEHCGEYLSEHIEDGGLGIKQTILAYPRQQKNERLATESKSVQVTW